MTAAAPVQAQNRAYQRTVREALREFEAGHWNEARVLFRAAHEIYPNARTLRGIGMTYFEVREYAEAYRNLQLALTSDVRPLDRRQRRQTEELARRASQFLGHLLLVVSPEEAAVTIDMDELRYEDDGSVLVDLEGHTLQVEAEGYVTQTQRFSLEGGESKTLTVDLQLIPPPAPPPPPEKGFPVVPVVWGAAGAFAVMTGVGIGWYVNRSNEVDKCEAAQADPSLDCENASALASQRDGALAFTIASVALMAGAAATAVVLMLVGDDPEDDAGADDEDTGADTVTVACGPAFLGVACAGRF